MSQFISTGSMFPSLATPAIVMGPDMVVLPGHLIVTEIVNDENPVDSFQLASPSVLDLTPPQLKKYPLMQQAVGAAPNNLVVITDVGASALESAVQSGAEGLYDYFASRRDKVKTSPKPFIDGARAPGTVLSEADADPEILVALGDLDLDGVDDPEKRIVITLPTSMNPPVPNPAAGTVLADPNHLPLLPVSGPKPVSIERSQTERKRTERSHNSPLLGILALIGLSIAFLSKVRDCQYAVSPGQPDQIESE